MNRVVICRVMWACIAEHKRFVQLLDMRFKDINAYMNEMSGDIDKYLQVILTDTDTDTHLPLV